MNRKNISRLLLLVILFVTIVSSLSFAEKIDIRVIENRGLKFNKGMYSDQIRVLKDYFRAKGEKDVTWGYLFDEKTKSLVSKFQKEQGLPVNGIVDKATLDKINKDIIENRYNLSIREPKVVSKGDMIVVNKSSNTLYHFRDGKIYKTYPVATGKTPDLTPDGKHKVVLKVKNPAWGGAGKSDPIPGGDPKNPLGKRWIGISYGGGHSYGMHGNSNAASIGKNLSLGCIRMFNEDVEKFYEEIKNGTPVWIGTEDVLINYGVKFEDRFTTNKRIEVEVKPEEDLNKPKVVEDVSVYFKDLKVGLENPIMNYEDVNYYPVRNLVELLGGDVFWYDETKTVIIVYGNNKVEFSIDSNDYSVNDVLMPLPEGQRPFISDTDSIYIPIRYVMEGLGFIVEWDEANKTIHLTEYNVNGQVEIPDLEIYKEPI